MAHWTQGDYEVDTDPARLDRGMIPGFLRSSYWAENVPFEVVERACRNSLCFGLHRSGRQVGFARAVSDRARIAWMADVFVLPEHRGRGLTHFLVGCALAHPEPQGLRWLLGTRDAHALYTRLDAFPIPIWERRSRTDPHARPAANERPPPPPVSPGSAARSLSPSRSATNTATTSPENALD